MIAYCRIGERSSHTWFVLSQLLGFGTVRNYDGSWTEWGNAVRVPIAPTSTARCEIDLSPGTAMCPTRAVAGSTLMTRS